MSAASVKLSPVKLQGKSPYALQKIATRKSKEIIGHIKELKQKIAQAEEALGKAKAEWSFLGLTTNRQHQLSLDAQSIQIEVLKEMPSLIQNTITYSCMTLQFAKMMYKSLNRNMRKGFADVDEDISKILNAAD